MARKELLSKEQNDQINATVNTFVEHMSALGISLSKDEIEDKRRELVRMETGVIETPDDAGAMEYDTFDDVAALMATAPEGEILTLDDYKKLDDKALLLNIPFFINRWWFTEGDMGTFAVLRIITKRQGQNEKWVVTDGSTGIMAQLREVTKRTGKTAGLLVRNGLRVSEYTADTETGPKMAKTFYLT